MDTLKEHLRRIARDRQKKLRKKLGATGYSEHMRKISKSRKKKLSTAKTIAHKVSSV